MAVVGFRFIIFVIKKAPAALLVSEASGAGGSVQEFVGLQMTLSSGLMP